MLTGWKYTKKDLSTHTLSRFSQQTALKQQVRTLLTFHTKTNFHVFHVLLSLLFKVDLKSTSFSSAFQVHFGP